MSVEEILKAVASGKVTLDAAKVLLASQTGGASFKVQVAEPNVRGSNSYPMLYFTGNFRPKKLSANMALAMVEHGEAVAKAAKEAIEALAKSKA